MINGLAMQTTSVGKAVKYFIGDTYYDKGAKKWKDRDPVPVVLEGDPKSIIQACDGINFKHKYTSGVLSFSPEETKLINATPGLKDEIFQDFKNFAFAGVAEDCRNILAVQHTHTSEGRLEIHYLIPRVHLESGKSWNPFEPNYKNERGPGSDYKFREQNDKYIDHACMKFRLQNPRDLSVARDIKMAQFDKGSSSKKEVHKFVYELVISGHITCREDIEEYLKKAGGKITRSNDEYISVKFSGDQKAMRLKGGIYDKAKFGGSAFSTRDLYERQKPGEECIRRGFEGVIAERIDRVEKRHSETKTDFDNKETRSDELEQTHSELESEFREYVTGLSELEKSTEDLGCIKSDVADFVSSHSSEIAEYKDKAASIPTGVSCGSDVAAMVSDDPVIRFFNSQMKQLVQGQIQRALAALKKGGMWSEPSAADKLQMERIRIAVNALVGIFTGINIDRPGVAFDRKAMTEATAKAAVLKKERAQVLEAERLQVVKDAVAKQLASSIKQREIEDEKARQERERRSLPSLKRNGHDLDDQYSGYRPDGS